MKQEAINAQQDIRHLYANGKLPLHQAMAAFELVGPNAKRVPQKAKDVSAKNNHAKKEQGIKDRQEIVDLLQAGSKTAMEISKQTGATAHAVRHRLSVLKREGIAQITGKSGHYQVWGLV